MKKANLKAKRLVNVVQYNAKGRNVVPKWEDVSPFIVNFYLSLYKKSRQMTN